MAWFGRDKEQKITEGLTRYLRTQLANASKEFDKAQPSRLALFAKKQKSNPLDIQPLVVGGFNQSLHALVAFGAHPAAGVISVAGALAIEVFFQYYRNLETTAPEGDGTKERLSSNLVSQNNRKVDYTIAKMRYSIQTIIVSSAEYIEMGEFASLDEVMKEEHEPGKQQKIKSLVNSQYRLHVSHRSLMIALQLFSAINQELLEKIDRERTHHPDKAHKFLVTNAVFVYEIADFIIKFLEDFELQGAVELRLLYRDAMAEIARGRERIEDVRQRIEERAESGRGSILNLDNERRSLDHRLAAIGAVDAVWAGLVEKIDAAEGGSRIVRDYIADIEIIKQNAELNLMILSLMVVTQMVRENIEKMQQLMLEVDKLRLPAITANDVRRFFTLDHAPPARPVIEVGVVERD